MEGVVSVFPSENKQLHTTRSWDFIGFPQDVKRAPLESDVIVGMLDTVIYIWTCLSMVSKLIGAKYYDIGGRDTLDEQSARDTDGHGTHTASTVAGRAVNNASLLGLAKGTARGGVPSARIAVYKICFPTSGCSDADILAAFDDAIADGVDIISLSVGVALGEDQLPIYHLGRYRLLPAALTGSFLLRLCWATIRLTSFGGPRNALLSGASGVVINGDFGSEDYASNYPLPTTYLSSKDGNDPDLTAPGVHILAAWSQGTTVTGDEGDTRVVRFKVLSGTSMACPHASGAAAYVKSFHPTWSPAAIKSALMTTAAPMSPTKNPEAEFAYGSGHIDPLKAVDPGLVYDAGEQDFVAFLCGQGYKGTILRIVTGDSSACSATTNATVWDLNYPSFALSANIRGGISRSFSRTVTNVGAADSSYLAKVVAPSGLAVQVSPSSLAFKAVGEKQSFVVTVYAAIGFDALSGSLVWSDGVHKVTSPIVAFLS
ncbi:hypothetical protein L1987_35915 [Smallanthus sonchifolius]|uniref:Uncharacterized protein n=1 Tax=Smallanthus sonchifolius TaxID=185202 RepID=A0ACB9HBR4_9ASTR|nr:hypothetical protein L1987_35915 [Smallanthus sonchifolius]